MVRAGYVEFDNKKSSLLGVPQGGIASPILSNLVLHELDVFILKLQETNSRTLGNNPTTIRNPDYYKIDNRIHGITKLERKWKLKGIPLDIKRKLERVSLIKIRSKLSSTIPNPGFMKFYYVRYADD